MSIDPRTYHDRTTHRPQRYAASLGYMDWANQPNPFRRFVGAPLHRFLRREWEGPSFQEVVAGTVTPEDLDLGFLDRLFYSSLALSAWKAIPGSRWPLRVNPSSGNLHPTEGYVWNGSLDEDPRLYHYVPREHGIEERATMTHDSWAQLTSGLPKDVLFLGLTSIHWRESWKYGERAYRYCQHDAGHAIGAVAYAAACLGWRARLLTTVTDAEVADLLGIADQRGIEAEHPDCLLLLHPNDVDVDVSGFRIPPRARQEVMRTLRGEPNRLSSNHHPWPVIDEIAGACEKADANGVSETLETASPPPLRSGSTLSAVELIRGRRSAVAMDGTTSIDRATFYGMMERALAGADHVPHSVLPWRPRIHLALFVHRVDGLPPGLYVLERSRPSGLRSFLGGSREWHEPEACPGHLPLFLLEEADSRPAAKATSCHQDIAADGCFALAMLAEFTDSIAQFGPWFYRALHWEAGLVGQTLYLEAERAGIRSTGIGCFFDDLTHEVIGYHGDDLQVIYHFTVGGAVDDPRLQTLPAYED